MLNYIKFLIFAIRTMFHIRHFKEFEEYDGSKGKNHKLLIREMDRKIKGATCLSFNVLRNNGRTRHRTKKIGDDDAIFDAMVVVQFFAC